MMEARKEECQLRDNERRKVKDLSPQKSRCMGGTKSQGSGTVFHSCRSLSLYHWEWMGLTVSSVRIPLEVATLSHGPQV